ncbi:hypothetical protein FHT36_001744 [Xanthobacter sp. SG618]|uniref:hypothetical protein n=1 Tax=Xanthobacter sp. SG618 TaxID=2587121 RepID=UPI00145F89DC|nr:hypothetical protein [Xanthobacter sp. SG618]NMN57847.1 hypothetical protein [Xanthobacter sp. SG618]
MSFDRVQLWVGTVGGCLAIVLGVVKLWETFLKDRPRLRTSYSFSTAPGDEDTITIFNISPTPVQVINWTLQWEPKGWRHRERGKIDVTPDDGGGAFKIGPRDSYVLGFDERDKFDWGYRASEGRRLTLTLYTFVTRKPIRLTVSG